MSSTVSNFSFLSIFLTLTDFLKIFFHNANWHWTCKHFVLVNESCDEEEQDDGEQEDDEEQEGNETLMV